MPQGTILKWNGVLKINRFSARRYFDNLKPDRETR